MVGKNLQDSRIDPEYSETKQKKGGEIWKIYNRPGGI